MKRFLGIFLLVLAFGVVPTVLPAQQSTHDSAGKETVTAPNGAADQSRAGKADSREGKRKQGAEQWAAKHKKLQQQLNDMDKRLEEKVAAMNAAAGDQKMAAMSDVINEMAGQRRELMGMFREHHARMGKMKCPKMGGMKGGMKGMHDGGHAMNKGMKCMQNGGHGMKGMHGSQGGAAGMHDGDHGSGGGMMCMQNGGHGSQNGTTGMHDGDHGMHESHDGTQSGEAPMDHDGMHGRDNAPEHKNM
ncbi:MAG: hypothetical protein AAGU11_15715 [Syntrophobacteraceae bacterium]